MLYKNQHFTQSELKGQDFANSIFNHCVFGKADLKFKQFANCHFLVCDLSAVLLENTSFHRCVFPESKLSFLDFANTSLRECDFSSTMMEECVFQRLKNGSNYLRKTCDLRHCKYQKTVLNRSIFVQCDLTEVDFKDAQLTQVVFEKCVLQRTNMIGCNIDGANFSSSKVQKCLLNISGFIQLGYSQGFVEAQANITS